VHGNPNGPLRRLVDRLEVRWAMQVLTNPNSSAAIGCMLGPHRAGIGPYRVEPRRGGIGLQRRLGVDHFIARATAALCAGRGKLLRHAGFTTPSEPHR
jgi:hypothetical protein